MEPDLSVTVHGIRFKNPLVVAPATPTGGARYLRRCFESGAGAVVAKSVSDILAHQDYIRPRFTILNRNAYPWSFSNYSSEFAAWQSVDEWMRDLKLAKTYADEHGAVLIGSIFSASTVDRWVELAKMQEDIGCELQQRVALSRALLLDPRMLLMDEPPRGPHRLPCHAPLDPNPISGSGIPEIANRLPQAAAGSRLRASVILLGRAAENTTRPPPATAMFLS